LVPARSRRRSLGNRTTTLKACTLQAAQDPLDAAEHLGRGATGESKQKDAPRVGARGDAVGHSVGQRGRLACARAGHYQQGLIAVQDREPLLLVEAGQDSPDGGPAQGVIHAKLPLLLLWWRHSCKDSGGVGQEDPCCQRGIAEESHLRSRDKGP